ncbi:MAG: acyltransferase [Armatimonadetes bacterium]|nr:acyltransferase [Armatimonadota bacterium]
MPESKCRESKPAQAKTTSGRLPELDILRALAVFMVILHHWDKQPPESFVLFKPLYWFFSLFWRLGWNGVDLFFVLSGFLVSGLLYREYQKKGSVRILRFLTRRGLKIYPAFYFFIFVTVLVDVLLEPTFVGPMRGRYLLGELTFLQNYLGRVWGHTWSLAIEEHFYLLLGLYIFFLVRRRRKKIGVGDLFRGIVPLFVAIAAICLALRIATYSLVEPVHSMTHWFPTHLRVDSLLFGVLLSYYYNMRHEKMKQWVEKNRRLLIVASPLLVLSCFPFGLSSWMRCTIGLTLTYLGFGGLLLICVFRLINPPALARPALLTLALIGSYSYSIYLWHLPMLWLTKHVETFFLSLGLYLAGCVIVGCALSKFVEYPVLRLRDRLIPSESGSLARQPAEHSRSIKEKGGVTLQVLLISF